MPLSDIANRAFVWETQKITLRDTQETLANSSNTEDNVLEALDVFKTYEISVRTDFMEAEAGKDPADSVAKWRWPRPARREWTVNLTGVNDGTFGTDTATSTHNFFSFASNVESGQLLFTFHGPKALSGNNHVKIEGYMTVKNVELSYPGEASEQSISLVGFGPPTVTIDTSVVS